LVGGAQEGVREGALILATFCKIEALKGGPDGANSEEVIEVKLDWINWIIAFQHLFFML